MRIGYQLLIGIGAVTAVFTLVLWRPILSILAIGWADLMTTHTFLIWVGFGVVLLLAVVGGILLKFRRK